MKKIGILKVMKVLTICVLVLVVAACSRTTEQTKPPAPESSGTKSPTPEQSQEPITLRVGWVIPPENKDWPKMFEAFNKKFPWIKVEGVYAENGEDELIKSLAAGQTLDVIWNTSLDRAITEDLIQE